jgi:uncharacterized damage-inducible protein DinB
MKAVSCIFLVTLCLAGAVAQDSKPVTSAAPLTGARAEYMRVFDDLNSKFVSLAEAIPAEKYDWRPGDGVRSVREVFTHVANGNYGFMSMAGNPFPAGVDGKSIDALTDKAKIVDALKQSFDHVRQIYGKMQDADFEKPAKMGNRQTTVHELFFYLITHEPEHLGQLIAYARMVNVVPPWTAVRQAQQQQQQKK